MQTSEMVDPDKIHRFQKDPHSEFPQEYPEIPSSRKKRIPQRCPVGLKYPEELLHLIGFPSGSAQTTRGRSMSALSSATKWAGHRSVESLFMHNFQALPLAKKELGETLESERISVLFLAQASAEGSRFLIPQAIRSRIFSSRMRKTNKILTTPNGVGKFLEILLQ